jgi:hypothetical protein
MFVKTLKTLLNPKGGCMKKLLVLALVLSIATIANAGLVVSGAPADMLTGATATINITTDSIISSAAGGEWNGWALVVETSLAGLSGGAAVVPNETGVSIFDGVMAGAGFAPPAGTDGVSGTILAAAGPIAASSSLFTGITLTAGQTTGLAHLVLVLTNDYEIFTTQPVGTVNITPEPITMTLLGLGGLFLRRRSK